MGFDSVDRAFQPKNARVKLECENCGSTSEGVESVFPYWYNMEQKVCLCKVCALLHSPTAIVLIQQETMAWALIVWRKKSYSQ
jgi:hypothetical protein